MKPDTALQAWCEAIEEAIGASGVTCVDRVRVLAETRSTQDACMEACAGWAGMLVVADRQTGGRGRLGRAWAHGGGLGIAATFALDGGIAPERLSLAGGLAAWDAVQGRVKAEVALRWPNDVVERTREGPGRKIGGVLVEKAGGVALLGVGINVRQGEADFPEELRGKAASIGMLGGEATRLDVLVALMIALDRALRTETKAMGEAWRARDCLVGLERVFEQGGRRVRGVVREIEPLGDIVLETVEGVVRLPALTTSMVHEGDEGRPR